MAELNFPSPASSPWTDPNGVVWVHDGDGWLVDSVSGAAVLRDGSTTLTANWNAGSYTIESDGFILGDNGHLYCGVGNDLDIYSDGTNAFIESDSNGTISIRTGAEPVISAYYNAGNSYAELRYNNVAKLTSNSTGVNIVGTLDGGNDIRLTEAADHTIGSTAGKGIIWVRNDTPCSLIFTDDAGTDYKLGGSYNPWVEKTSAYTAVDGDRILVDLTSDWTLTLPASPNVGDEVWIQLDGNTSAKTLTIARNSSKIFGIADDMTESTPWMRLHLVYFDATIGWVAG
jgi:hypothetical protein